MTGELTIDVDGSTPGVVRLDWRGRSLVRRPDDVLAAFLSRCADRAIAGEARLDLHFEELEHMNSSTIAVLMQLLYRLRPASIEVVLYFRANLAWQQLSFEALRIFAAPHGRLRIEPT